MTPYTPQEIEQRFARLPEPLKDEMMSVENSERIFEVGKKFGLTIEQIGFLAEEAGYVVLGLTHPNNFVARLKDHLHTDEQKAKTIAQEINHQVFFPLREILKTTHQFELTQEQIQASPSPIPPIPRIQPIIPKVPPNTPTTSTPPIPATKNSIPPTTPPVPRIQPIILKALPLVAPIPPVPPLKSSPLPPALPVYIQKPPVTPILTSPHSATIPPPPVQKILVPIPPPPPRALEPMISPTISPPLPPINRQTPPLLTHPNLPPSVPSGIQNKPNPIGQPITPPAPKLVEGIKQKEPSLPPPAPSVSQQPALPEHTVNSNPAQQNTDKTIQPPAPPSQIMQKKFLDETGHTKTPIRPEVERIKESLFAPPSAPAQPEPSIQPQSQSKTETPAPSPESPSKPPAPSSYATHDPYREPIE